MNYLKLLTLLCLTTLTVYAQKDPDCNKNETARVFGLKLKSKSIAGGCFGNSSHFYRSEINPTFVEGTEVCLNQLGSYRSDYSYMETRNLFNVSHQKDIFPTLDSIDINFYDAVGIDLLKKELTDKQEFKDFKKEWDKLGSSIADRKKLLNTNTEIRFALARTRYNLITQKPFSVDQKKVSSKTAEIKAQLDTIKINATAEVAAKVRAYLYSLADKHIVIEGEYIVAELTGAYIGRIINRFQGDKKPLNGTDQFSLDYNSYRKSPNEAAINTGLVAIKLKGKYDDTRISNQSVAAELQSKFTLPAADYKRISASLLLTFENSRTTTLKVNFNDIYVLRYFTNRGVDKTVGTMNLDSLNPKGTVLLNIK